MQPRGGWAISGKADFCRHLFRVEYPHREFFHVLCREFWLGGHGQLAPFTRAAVADALADPIYRVTLPGVFSRDILERRADQFGGDRMAAQAVTFARQGLAGPAVASARECGCEHDGFQRADVTPFESSFGFAFAECRLHADCIPKFLSRAGSTISIQ